VGAKLVIVIEAVATWPMKIDEQQRRRIPIEEAKSKASELEGYSLKSKLWRTSLALTANEILHNPTSTCECPVGVGCSHGFLLGTFILIMQQSPSWQAYYQSRVEKFVYDGARKTLVLWWHQPGIQCKKWWHGAKRTTHQQGERQEEKARFCHQHQKPQEQLATPHTNTT
jgi:hypothetical protein